jgi:hypothetical protein
MINTIHLQLLLATFAGWVGRQQSHVIACLIEENGVLKEQLGSRGKRLHRYRGPTSLTGSSLPNILSALILLHLAGASQEAYINENSW